MFQATIQDDRGNKVPLVKQEFFLPGLTNATDIERRDRLVAASNGGGGPITWREIRSGFGYVLLVSPVLLAAAIAPSIMSFKLKWPLWALLLEAIPLGIVPLLVTVWCSRRIVGQRMARVYKRAGYCPSCSYDLHTVDESTNPSDGCRICPECGGAWLIETTSK